LEGLNQLGLIGLPDLHAQQADIVSPASKGVAHRRWTARAPLSIPRTEINKRN
jgi:hypothetical protein